MTSTDADDALRTRVRQHMFYLLHKARATQDPRWHTAAQRLAHYYSNTLTPHPFLVG